MTPVTATTLITLIWTDGTMTTGKSWRELEDAVRASQWQPFKSRKEFRREMRRRAALWSGDYPPATRSSKAFIQSLADAGLFMIVTDDEL